MNGLPRYALLACCLFVLAGPCARAGDGLPATVAFNRDIRPILSDHCSACHGPDKGKRKADLRLDIEESAKSVLVPGKPAESELFLRVTEKDPKRRMPPASMKNDLTPQQIALLRRWIEQGARYEPHWAFIPPKRPPLPPVKDSAWVRNPLDAFVLAKLEKEGLAPSPLAERTTLLRRLSFDLTGLPPTPEEVDDFLNDPSPGAYERVVERLLASPRHGERMAVRWLDAARYADTSGYQSDGERIMWRWRDWVIASFNANLPFDQFTVEQIAGDLLPGATLEQKIATGFNRNHRGNAEGGIIPEEYAAEYVADRVETTATVFLGLTLTCARCHNHKYDPFTQKEFYQLFAFFNNVPEFGRAIKFGNSPPMILSPTRRQQEQLAALDRELEAAGARVKAVEPALVSGQKAWEETWRPGGNVPWAPAEGLAARFSLDGGSGKVVFKEGAPAFAPGPPGNQAGRSADLDGKRYLDAGDAGKFGYLEKFSFSLWVYPRGDRGGALVSRMGESPRADGYAVTLERGRIQVNLVKRWLDDAIRVGTRKALTPDEWHHVSVTYDGSRLASGIKVYLDGQEAELVVHLDLLNQDFANKEPLRIGSGGGPDSRFTGRIADVRIYSRVLDASEAAILATPEGVEELVKVAPGRRTAGQALKVRDYYLHNHALEEVRAAHRTLAELTSQRCKLIESFPTTMVMQEMPTPRPTHVLLRGQYDRKGERVQPGTPAVLPPMPADTRRNRLGLGRWLVDPANPLTARVTVNRMWQMYFGAGLVRTSEDFGAQGEPPTHPELLDWLAVELVQSGWDLKHLHRLIVTSATYRQSSRLTPALRARDPENRLLARAPRLRLSAEMVRDNALAVSGLLVERLGGPSVKPYQPDGLWQELADTEYRRDRGEKLYRRGLYTFWKRTVAPPALVTFDAAGREVCNVRDVRTNTPLQALNLLNDITYVEAARALAQRVLLPRGHTPAERITTAFRLATGRPPRPAELKVLLAGLEQHRAHYRDHRDEAVALLRAGDSPAARSLDPTELAAYTAVASTILNLDEVITRE